MGADGKRWSVRVTGEVRHWLRDLRHDDPASYESVRVAVDKLAEVGPGLGRPLVDTLRGSNLRNLKELRPRSGRGQQGGQLEPLVPAKHPGGGDCLQGLARQ
ncbi:hypothetical protein [Micromonospora sp. NPDC049282]|uniref:hypothetical protein n=1 Tax=Micromonospora sp. NPDC049282 TaxID=3364269 RepID=UPI00371D8A76